MKLPFLAVVLSLAAFFVAQPSQAQNAFTPDQVKWGPAPAFIPAGAQLAVLEGNPMGDSGDYTIRLKMPDGYKIAPHTHPLRENVTVISGTLKVWYGQDVRCQQDDERRPWYLRLHGSDDGALCGRVWGDGGPDSRAGAGKVQLHQPGG
jgi:hypothetical protein